LWSQEKCSTGTPAPSTGSTWFQSMLRYPCLVRSRVLECSRNASAACSSVGPLCCGRASCCSWRLRSRGSLPVCLDHALMRSHSSRASLGLPEKASSRPIRQ
jgi:hypothetical protein